jgi:hypothetical protein
MHSDISQKLRSWLVRRQNASTGLIKSFDNDHCVVSGQAFTYDQALASIVFTAFDNLDAAEGILAFFVKNTTDPFVGYANAYDHASGRVTEHTVHCGPNIWLGIAALQHYAKTDNPGSFLLCEQIACWIMDMQMADPDGGIKGGPASPWFSTEHHLDAYAFFQMIHQVTGQEKYTHTLQLILSWLKKHAFNTDAGGDHLPPVNRGWEDPMVATDVYALSLMALGPRKLKEAGLAPEAILAYAEKHCAVEIDCQQASGRAVRVRGFDFTSPERFGRAGMISPEWTCQMIIAYRVLGHHYAQMQKPSKGRAYHQKADQYLQELSKLIITDSRSDSRRAGASLPYATSANAATGHGWRTPTGPDTGSIAGTAYMFLALRGVNPLIAEDLASE